MPPGAIEQAFIEVLADTSNFSRSLEKGVKAGLDDIRKYAERTFTEFREQYIETGDTFSRTMREAARSVIVSFQDTNATVDSLAEAVVRAREAFETLGPEGVRQMRMIEKAVERLDSEQLDAVDDTMRRLDSSFERFGERARASLGRAAVSGPERLEDSLKDLGDTAVREMGILEASVGSALDQLGDTKELRRLKQDFAELADQIQSDFGRSIVRAIEELEEMRKQGTLSASDVRVEVARLSQELDRELEGALQKVNQDLRLVRGNADAFREVTDEVDELQDALLRLERQSHDRIARDMADAQEQAARAREEIDRVVRAAFRLDELDIDIAREFREGTLSVERLREELRKLDTTAESVQKEVEQVGTSARRAAARGNDAFGSMVASANRFRFVMLDLRFLAGAVGLFLAQRFASFGLEAASSIEQAKLSFQVLARSIEGDLTQSFDEFDKTAEVSLNRVIEFARETPFSLEEVTEAVRRLNAFLPSFGIAGEEALSSIAGRTEISIELFEDMGGALAVLGNQDSLPKLVKALGDVGARGKLTAEEVRQFANALPGLEIRTAIITGIFDPMVQTSDQILALREEFSKFGADASQAPQEALAAFVDFQRRGLITTDVVVEGLRASFRNLAGDDALQAFTMTIDGVIEKLKEAAEVGSARGFSELAPTLIREILPALELVEDASETFARALTNLATQVVPFALQAFGDMTAIGEKFFDELADLIERNTGLIEESLERFPDAVGTAIEGLAQLLDTIGPLIPLAIDLADVWATKWIIYLEILEPIIRAVAEALDSLHPAMLLVIYQGGKVVKIMQGMRGALVAANLAAAPLTGTFGKITVTVAGLTTAIRLAGAAFAGLVIGGEIWRGYQNDLQAGREAADEFRDSVLRLDSVNSFEELGVRVGLAVDSMREKVIEGRDEFLDETDTFTQRTYGYLQELGGLAELVGTGLSNLELGIKSKLDPDFTQGVAEMEALQQQAQELEDKLIGTDRVLGSLELGGGNIDRALGRVRTALITSTTEFDKTSLAVALTDEAMQDLLFASGLTADEIVTLALEGIGPLKDALFDALEPDLAQHLRDIGIEADRLTMDEAIDAAADLETGFRNAATALSDLTNQIRAQNDPVFAAADANKRLEEAYRNRETAIQDLEIAEQQLAELPADADASAREQAQQRIDEANQAIADSYGQINDAAFDVAFAIGDLAAAAADPEINASVQNTKTVMGQILDGLIEDEALAQQVFDNVAGGLDGIVPTAENLIGVFGVTEETAAILAAGLNDSASYAAQGVENGERRITDGLGKVVASANVTETQFSGHMDEVSNAAYEATVSAAEDFASGREKILSETRQIGGAGSTIKTEFQNGIAGLPSYLRGIGIEAKDSFLDQFSYFDAFSRGQRMANALADGVRGGLQAQSPSRVMMDIAGDAVDGVTVGIDKRLGDVSKAGANIASALATPIDVSRINPVRPPSSSVSPATANSGPRNSLTIGTIQAPSPEEAARRTVGAYADYLYLNHAEVVNT